MRISVIIPTYNRSAMLLEAVGSVLEHGAAEVEIIVVDDGSVDGTGSVLRERYGGRVSYVYQEKKGRSAARNRGLLNARGRYLLFLDSDDLVLPESLDVRAQYLDGNPAIDVVCCDGDFCDAGGRILCPVSRGRPPVDEARILETLVLHNIVGAPHFAMIRRSALEALGGPVFDEDLHGMEDADLWIRLAARGARFALIPSSAGKYRLHGAGNESSPQSPNRLKREESVRRFRYKVFESGYFPGLPEAVRQEFIRQFLLDVLRGREEEQRALLNHARVRELPEAGRARLFYFVGRQMMTDGSDVARAREYLRQAAALDPQKKYSLMSALSRNPRLFRAVIGAREGLGRRMSRPDASIAPHWQGRVHFLS